MAELFCSALQTSWSSSRVTTGNSGCLSCWPREVQSSIRVASFCYISTPEEVHSKWVSSWCIFGDTGMSVIVRPTASIVLHLSPVAVLFSRFFFF